LGAGWEDKVMFQTGIIPLGKLKNGQVSSKVDVGLFSWFAQQIPYLEASVQDGQQYYTVSVNSSLVKWAMTSPTSTLTPCSLLKAQVWVDLTGASLPAGVYSCNYSISAKVSVKQPGGDPLVSDDSICVSFEVY